MSTRKGAARRRKFKKRAFEVLGAVWSFAKGYLSCYNIFASEKWQPATSRDISLPKLLE